MMPYPRRVNVTTSYNAKGLVWYAMLDDDRDITGMGQQEADAVYDLFCQIAEREADDEERCRHETERDPDEWRDQVRDDKMWDEQS